MKKSKINNHNSRKHLSVTDRESNIQNPASSIQYPASSIQYPVSSIQHPASSIQHPASRCSWCGSDPLYVKYHDEEWGVPVHDDNKLFEMLILEGAQAGLSWITILKKRENYRKVFAGFDAVKIAKFSEVKIGKLLSDPGIVRNRLKVNSTVINAKAFLAVKKEFGTFDKYIWQFVGYKTKVNKFKNLKDLPAKTEESDAMSKDLKKRGFKFIGSTICYAFMQAVGMVNDHTINCFRYKS
ncbi:MAG: DNA-3-methyladenine glycosylase I [Bacteroidetes bacterium]|nr:DNA-3-methyladenine glycosylase I [Bacteroidota bacterium]